MAGQTSALWSTEQTPSWAGDYFSREHVLPGGGKLDKAQFNRLDAVQVTAAAAAAGAVSVTLTATQDGTIPAGTILDFGTDKLAVTTAARTYVAGVPLATPVRAIPTALAGAETATYAGTAQHIVPSGTLVGRTYLERESNIDFGPAAAADDEIFIVVWDVDLTYTNDVDLLRPNSIVKENLLPGYASLAAGVVTKLRAIYTTTKGV
jgi:hypothetical protein